MEEKEQSKAQDQLTQKRPKKPANQDAFKQLRQAVGKEVREQSTEIAQSLVKSTLAGNSNNARLVVSLVDKRKKKKIEVESKLGKSVAMDLAAMPQCPPEDDEFYPDFETGKSKP
ncbi:MAG: hypothetical protein WBE76_15935 [Terracidiphilus sp.]